MHRVGTAMRQPTPVGQQAQFRTKGVEPNLEWLSTHVT